MMAGVYDLYSVYSDFIEINGWFFYYAASSLCFASVAGV
jgi:hypothetical protein